MYRLIFFLIQFITLLFLLTLIFSNPFIISFDINDYNTLFIKYICWSLISILIIFYLIIYLFFKSRFSINKYILKINIKKLKKDISILLRL